MFEASPSRAGEGSWCYSNETDHCGEPNFATCHFGTLGNGGYCYVNASYRGSARAQSIVMVRTGVGAAAHLARWHKPHHHIDHPDEAMASADAGSVINNKPNCQLDANGHFDSEQDKAACLAETSSALASIPARNEPQTVAARRSPANGVPTINVQPSCRAAAAGGIGQGMEACLADETSARDQLAQDWGRFPQTDRSSCVRLTTLGGGGTYTELLTCLEVKRDARNLPKENSGGSSGSPIVFAGARNSEFSLR